MGDTATANTSVRTRRSIFSAAYTLTKNTTYRCALKPTSANSVTLYYFDVAAAGHFQAHVGGTAWVYTDRVDAGSWAAVTATRRPFIFPYIAGIDDGAAGGTGRRRIIGS